jgi:hypothetical protein
VQAETSDDVVAHAGIRDPNNGRILALEPHLPRFSPQEQRTAVTLYRELAKGEAVNHTQLARALSVSSAQCRALLQRDSIKRLIYADGHGRAVGFGGLAAAPMHHRIEVDGRALSNVVRLGQSVHPGNPWPFRARRVS